MEQPETLNAGSLDALVRHAIPDMNDRKRYRYRLSLPFVLTLDLDEQFTHDEVRAMWWRAYREMTLNISGCNETGCYEMYCNVKVPNTSVSDPCPPAGSTNTNQRGGG